MPREVYSSFIFSFIQWQHENLATMLQPTLLCTIRRPWLVCKYKTLSQLRCVEHLSHLLPPILALAQTPLFQFQPLPFSTDFSLLV